MKTIMYIHHGNHAGGAPRSLRFLIEGLDKSVYRPVVVCRQDPLLRDLYESVGAEVIFEPKIKPYHGSEVSGIHFKLALRNIIYSIPTLLATARIVRRIKPDIVHINSTALFMCAKACKKFGNKICVVCHVREPLLRNIFGDILKRNCNKYVDRFIAIDEFDARSVDAQLSKTKIVYNFVNFAEYDSTITSNVLREELGIKKDEVIFLNLARISPENGDIEIVSLWKNCFACDSRMRLVLVGDAPSDYSEAVHRLAQGCDNIHILPFRSDVVNLIAASDVMLCSFVRPHFSRAIIEAASMGKPSVSNRIAGPNELIVDGDTGLFFDFLNPVKAAEVIKSLQQKPEVRNELGKKALDFAKENFSSTKNIQKTVSVYKDILVGIGE